MSRPDVRLEKDNKKNGIYSDPDLLDTSTAEYLSWRRLHLAKSKLKNVTEMASFMAGFAVVATVELQLHEEETRGPLLTAFVVTTSLLVGTCMIAIIISTCVLPHIDSVAKTSTVSGANLSPHDKMRRLIDISWILTNSASLFFFSLDVIIISWIEYSHFTVSASVAATVIMVPVLVINVVFAVVFYRKIVKHQYVISSAKYEELEKMQQQMERAASLNSISYQGTITSNNQASVGPSNTNLKKQWMLYQQQQRNHQQPYYSPHSIPNTPTHPGTPTIPHNHFVRTPASPKHYHPRLQQFIPTNHPHYNYTNQPYRPKQFSHPDHLPFHFSPNPNGPFDPRIPPPDTPTTTPVSLTGSKESLSPSVTTV